MVQALEESIQEAGQNQQRAAALPSKMYEAGENLGVTRQLAEDLCDPHLPMRIHGGFKIARHRHFHRVKNHAQGEGGNAAR